MAHEISISLRADPAPYEAAIKRLSKATSEWELSTAAGADDVDERFADVVRALVDMERQGGRTEAEVIKSLRGIGLSAENAEDAVKAIDRELAHVGDNKGGAAAAEDLEQISGKSGDVGDSIRSLGEIAKDVLTGDFASATQGALSGLGDLAAAAGVGGAVGSAVVGAISGLVQVAVDELIRIGTTAQRAKDETAAALVEMGGAFDDATILERMKEISNDTERWANANTLAEATGMRLPDVLRGLAGDGDLAAATLQRLRDVADEGTLPDALILRANAAAGELLGVSEAAGAAAPKIDALKQAQADMQAEAQGASGAVGELTGNVDALGNAVVRLPDGKEVVITAETLRANAQIDQVEARQVTEKSVKITVDSSDYDNWYPMPKYVEVRAYAGGALGPVTQLLGG